jgi:AcrR family transcriptional regulator
MSKVPVLRIPEAARGRPQQKRSIEKRAKLMEAGRALFGARGYERVAIGEITSRAGTAAGAFYQFFSSKRQFLVELMNEFLAGLGRVDLGGAAGGAKGGDGGDGDARLALRAFLASAFRVDAAHYGVVRAWQEATLADGELRKMRGEIERWSGGRVLGVFRALQAREGARRDVDVKTFARMMDRHFWSLLGRGAGMTAREFRREVDVSADVIWWYLFGEARAEN